MNEKAYFERELKSFVKNLQDEISTPDGQWAIKGFIDTFQNVYSLSSDTKIISKILELHLFPKIERFAQQQGYAVVLAQHQNYYPDVSLVKLDNNKIKFALDFKTTYRKPNNPLFCNGFTLGSHGQYFIDRSSTKNIQFPYADYAGHFCLGIIYDRVATAIDETSCYQLDDLGQITSVISNLQFFIIEKWKIASDKSGSGNTANIGSINYIPDIINGNGMFSNLGEKYFDDYWINYKKITLWDKTGSERQIASLKEFVEYKGGDVSLIVPKYKMIKQGKK